MAVLVFYAPTTVTDMEYSLAGFNGQRPDPVSGHSHLGNGYRAYNPVLGRFTAPDSWSPFGAGGINPYAYCIGDPINRADPSGHFSLGQGIGMALGIVAGIALSALTQGLALGPISSLLANVVGDAFIGAGSELVANSIDGQRVNVGQVGIAAGEGALMGLLFNGVGMIGSKLKGPGNRPFGGLMLAARERNNWRGLWRTKPRISHPAQLRIYNDTYPRFISNKKNLLDKEIASAKWATTTRGGRTSTIHNLYELKQYVYFHDGYFHKFVLSEQNKLAISSISDIREFKAISHQALAFIENIEEPVKTAGTISANEQGIFKITNQSGHYRPSSESLKHMEALLASWGAIPQLESVVIL
jgi:RHS repeat-associated protein